MSFTESHQITRKQQQQRPSQSVVPADLDRLQELNEFAPLGVSSKDLLNFFRYLNVSEKKVGTAAHKSRKKGPQKRGNSNSGPSSQEIFVPAFTEDQWTRPRTEVEMSLANPQQPVRRTPARTTSEIPRNAVQPSPARGVRRFQSSGESPARPTRRPVTGLQHYSPQKAPPVAVVPEWERAMVQVVPGYSLPMAGTKESIAAYKKQAVQETICKACQSELYCVDSATMVLCPVCRSFSSINEESTMISSQEEQLGLGLTIELLVEELGNL